MAGRAVPRALATAVVLGVTAGLPGGAAVADAGDVPAYRTAEDAQAVDGARSSADGPRLASGRIYTDDIGPGEEKYYTVELDAESQPRISVTALPEAGSKVAYGDGVSVLLEGADGTSCGEGEADFGSNGAARPIAAWVARVTEPDGACQSAGVYNLSVTRESDPASGRAAWPVELRLMSEPGLNSLKSTEAPDTGDLPTEPPGLPTGTARQLEGGTGFNDAAGMGEGVWKDRLRPGGTRFYRVPVDWGQSLALSAEFGTAKTGDETAYTSDGVQVAVYNPARGYVAGEGAMYEADAPAAVPVRTPPAVYGHRYAYNDEVAAASVAGWYYVAVHAHADLGRFVDGTVPVTLRTELVGKPGDPPDYAGDPVAAGFGVSDADRDQAEEGLTPQAARRSDTLTVVGWSGVGTGTLLLAGLALWWGLARRSAGGSAGGPAAGFGAPPPLRR
ncbi:hypothetical protein E4198_12690 [Streptomyces sp. RKND-216]|uniref:hypothetical protein n=1 Tax=Streptomyces sp. RKND-216 TaxID=2562581 RepID=UPI00109E1839|nr:hypothetical protein [Streptomyces sp. RKND-216]THA25461.1 hypothetical protein E4198_12690 [Streptomyces sp. RKND-216]